MTAVLETIELTRHFGQIAAAERITIGFQVGEWVGIVGANGAGKTTFLNLITGYIKPESGQVLYLGRDITGLPPRRIVQLGIARSFQVPQLYAGLTVSEHLLIALAARERQGLNPWRPLRQRPLESEAMALLAQFGLQSEAHRPITELPEGKRKLLDIAVSFALQPRLLLLDEPTSGIGAEEAMQVMETLLSALRPSGVTVIFVEHDMEVVKRYAQRVLLLEHGRVVADGTPEQVLEGAPVLPLAWQGTGG